MLDRTSDTDADVARLNGDDVEDARPKVERRGLLGSPLALIRGAWRYFLAIAF